MTDLNALEKTDLQEAADYFGVEYKKTEGTVKLLARILADGVTQEMYDTFVRERDMAVARAELEAEQAEEEKSKPGVITAKQILEGHEEKPRPTGTAPVAVANDTQVLLLMTRGNPRFDIRGYTFTKRDPFVLVDANDAQFIMNHEEGFRPALPQEVSSYYDC